MRQCAAKSLLALWASWVSQFVQIISVYLVKTLLSSLLSGTRLDVVFDFMSSWEVFHLRSPYA